MIPQPTRAQLDALRRIVDGVPGSPFVPGWKRDGSIERLDTEGSLTLLEQEQLRTRIANERLADAAEKLVVAEAAQADAEFERDQAEAKVERWRRNFWWAVLIPAVAGLGFFWWRFFGL